MSLNVVPKVMWARQCETGTWVTLTAVNTSLGTIYWNRADGLVNLDDYDSFSCYDSFEDA